MKIEKYLLILLAIVSIAFIFLYFSDSSEHRKIIKQLERRADSLEQKKQELKDQSLYYRELAKQDSIEAAKYQVRIDSVNKVLAQKEIQIQILRGDLQVQKDKKKSTEIKIQNLRDNPIKRKGDVLIESLKEKLN